jgi:dihydroorotate dehydrogenase electron transfer subunit
VTALTLSAPRIAAAAKPGQFVHVQVPDPTSVLRRPLGIFEADAAAGTISLLFQHVGSGTKALAGVAAGDSLSLLGPLGRGWNPGGAKRALLAGGGLGAVPLLMLARELVECGAAVSAVLGAANAGLLVAEREFSATGGLDLHIATDDGSLGHHGFVTGPVGELLAQREYDYLAACGPEPMMRAVAALSGKAAASSSDAASSASSASSPAGIVCEVSLERRMACGVGACLSCVVNTSSGLKRACVDGPVFLAGELPW